MNINDKNDCQPAIEQTIDPAQTDFENGKKFMQEASYGQAANAFHNALLGFEQTNNEQGIANASDKLGDICRERQEFAKALLHYQRAQEICEHLKDTPSILALLKKKAFCHRSLGQLPETLSISFKLLDIYTDWQNPALSVEILSDIAGQYSEMGEREKAADAYKTASEIHRNYGHTILAQELLNKADNLLAS